MNSRVLHVIDSYAAGSATALQQYVRSTPDLQHHILSRARAEAPVPDDKDLFETKTELPKSFVAALKKYRETTKEIEPRIVHAHSSLAGLVTRLAAPLRSDYQIVYTPHCFAFERCDIGAIKRLLYRTTEMLLSKRTDALAACSPREARLARGLNSQLDIVFIPNIAGPSPVAADAHQKKLIITTGRLSKQKDPLFFAETVDAIRELGYRGQVEWLGTGDHGRSVLKKSNVTVTGWLSRADMARKLGQAELYVHTAQWEGAPMALLEAHAYGLPIVVRRIPAFEDTKQDLMSAHSPEEIAVLVTNLLRSPRLKAQNIEAWNQYFADNTRQSQRTRLLDAYSLPHHILL